MENKDELIKTIIPSRRKFVIGVGILSLFATIKSMAQIPFFITKKAIASPLKSKAKTIKMLTQDGRLVEIETSLIAKNRKKVTDLELQNWIKK